MDKAKLRRHMKESCRLAASGGYLSSTYNTDDVVMRHAAESVARCAHTDYPDDGTGEPGACVHCIMEAMRALLADPAPPGAVAAAE